MSARLFNSGQFRLHSGARSSFKIDCDALTDEDLDALAVQVAQGLVPYGRAVGVPDGGLRFAVALNRYSVPSANRLLIADDVFTTGASMAAERAEQRSRLEPGVQIIGCVIFARGKPPPWIHAICRVEGV